METQKFFTVLFSAKRPNCLRTGGWLAWNALGTGMPFILTWLVFAMISKPFEGEKAIRSGELLILAVALVIPAFFTITRDRKPGINQVGGVILAGVLVIVLGSGAFSALAVIDALRTAKVNSSVVMSIDTLRAVTWVLLFVSVAYAVCAQLVDDVLETQDPRDEERRTTNNLEEEITRRRENGG